MGDDRERQRRAYRSMWSHLSRIQGQQVPEIGYLLRAEYWHKGYATEAAIACKEYAFNILNFDKVYSIIRDTNIPSQKVALRNDMREIANFIKHYRNIDMLHLVFCVNKL